VEIPEVEVFSRNTSSRNLNEAIESIQSTLTKW